MIANFILAGQSNIDQWFHAGDGAALRAFEEAYIAQNPQFSGVAFFDAARGGSAILQASAADYAADRAGDNPDLFERISQNYWYDEANGEAGPNLANFMHSLADAVASGAQFQGIIWAQGEADTTYVGEHGSAEYSEGLGFVLDALAAAGGTPNIFIQALGDRAFYSEELHGGTTDIRDAQQNLADSSDTIILATTVFDLNLRDSAHLTVEAYEEAATRMAIAISTGETSPSTGEALMVSENRILIQIDLGPNQRFSGEFDLGGFSILDGGHEVEITSASMSTAGLLTIVTQASLVNPVVSYGDVAQSTTMQEGDFIYVTGPNGTIPILPFQLNIGTPTLQTTEIDGRFTIESAENSDVLTGFSGDDFLHGNAGHDILIGGQGRDRLYGGEGSDTFVLGNDSATDIVYDFSVSEDAIGLNGVSSSDLTFSVYNGTDLDIRTLDGQRIVLRNVAQEDFENIRFHTLGNDGDNHIVGSMSGDDRIFSFDGDDRINSGGGYDRITVGSGADTVSFGFGYDTNIVYDFDVSQDTIFLENTTSSALFVTAYGDTDIELRTQEGDRLILRDVDLSELDVINIEAQPSDYASITGTSAADVLRGTDLNELISSFGGTDRLYGGGGDDVFVFSDGSDLNVVYDFELEHDKVLIDNGSFSDVSIELYGTSDAEIRLNTSDRLVLRDVDYFNLDVDDFIFSTPDYFI